MSNDNKLSSNINPENPFWSNSYVIFNKVSPLPDINIYQCLRNNSIAVELLETNDSLFRVVTNKDEVDIPQNINVNIPSKNNNQASVPFKVSTKKSIHSNHQ